MDVKKEYEKMQMELKNEQERKLRLEEEMKNSVIYVRFKAQEKSGMRLYEIYNAGDEQSKFWKDVADLIKPEAWKKTELSITANDFSSSESYIHVNRKKHFIGKIKLSDGKVYMFDKSDELYPHIYNDFCVYNGQPCLHTYDDEGSPGILYGFDESSLAYHWYNTEQWCASKLDGGFFSNRKKKKELFSLAEERLNFLKDNLYGSQEFILFHLEGKVYFYLFRDGTIATPISYYDYKYKGLTINMNNESQVRNILEQVQKINNNNK